MKITIEPDTEGEPDQIEVFEHVTQCVLAGSLNRKGIIPGTFTFLRMENINQLIGMTTMLAEYLRDHKKKKPDASSLS